MSRLRSDTIKVKPANNVYTGLLGAACVAVLLAVVLAFLKWPDVVGTDGPKLFFGMF